MRNTKRGRRGTRPRILGYEPFETIAISQLLREGDTALDLGANVGHYTLVFGKIVGEQGRVFAFEPDPHNVERLRHHVLISGLQNVTIEQQAVSNLTGKVKLYLNARNPGDHRIFDSHDGRPSIEVSVTRLDDYFRHLTGRIDFIKLDIQGAELAAIEGMPELLEKNKSLQMATEFAPFLFKILGVDSLDYLKTLQEYGFSLSNINEGTKELEPITDLAEFVSLYPPEGIRFTNLLCTR